MKNRHVVSLALLVGTLCLLTGCEQSTNRTPSDIEQAEEAEQCNRTVVFVADGSCQPRYEWPPTLRAHRGMVVSFFETTSGMGSGRPISRYLKAPSHTDLLWMEVASRSLIPPLSSMSSDKNNVALHACPFTRVSHQSVQTPKLRSAASTPVRRINRVCDDRSSCDADGNCSEIEPDRPDCSATTLSRQSRATVCGPEVTVTLTHRRHLHRWNVWNQVLSRV